MPFPKDLDKQIETRLKMRLAKLGKKQTKEQIQKRIAKIMGMKKRPHSEEAKIKMSIAHTGKKLKPFTEEHKSKISEKLKLNNATQRKEVRDKISNSVRLLWRNKEYREKNIKATLKSLLKRPTTYETKLSGLLIKNGLPFIYTGNGTFLIGHKNPDFVDNINKVAIEVYHVFYKIRDYGSCEEYERQRSEYFKKYGWKTIFIRTDEIESKEWEVICLNKINGRTRE